MRVGRRPEDDEVNHPRARRARGLPGVELRVQIGEQEARRGAAGAEEEDLVDEVPAARPRRRRDRISVAPERATKSSKGPTRPRSTPPQASMRLSASTMVSRITRGAQGASLNSKSERRGRFMKAQSYTPPPRRDKTRAVSEPQNRPPRRSRLAQRLLRVEQAAANALEVMRLGRLSPRRDTPYEVVHRRHHRLRRYGAAQAGEVRPAILLVPPLMVTAEVSDDAELSAVTALVDAGIDTWSSTSARPSARRHEPHPRSCARGRRGRGPPCEGSPGYVHLAGYSQGGMFAYQCGRLPRERGRGLGDHLRQPGTSTRTCPTSAPRWPGG